MATIGNLTVGITAQTSKLESGIRKARKILGGFAGQMSSLLAGVSLAAAVHWFEAAGSELHDLSAATGIAIDQLDFLKYAAEQSGAGLEAVIKAARELQDKGIDPNRFSDIARQIAAIKDPTERAQAAFNKFGKKAGAAILPMINDLPELRRRWEELGGGMSQEIANRADALGDALGDVRFVMRNLFLSVAAELAPELTKLSRWIASHLVDLRKWMSEHKTLAKMIGGVAVGLATLTALGPSISALSGTVSLLNLALTGLGANPVVLAIAAIAVIIGGMAYNIYQAADATRTWEQRIVSLLSAFAPILGVAHSLAKLAGVDVNLATSGVNIRRQPAIAAAPVPSTAPTTAQQSTRVERNTDTMTRLLELSNAHLNEIRKQRGQQVRVAGMR